MTELPSRCRRTAITALRDTPTTTTAVARHANHDIRTTHSVANHSHLVAVSTTMISGAINHSATFVTMAEG